MNSLSLISAILGWVYFFAWSFSFYPLVWENYKLKSVSGVSIDYVFLNLTGYIFLCVYSTAGYFDTSLGIGEVHIEDLAFAFHGALLTAIIIGQMGIYPLGANKLSKAIISTLVIMWAYTIIYVLITIVYVIYSPPNSINAYKLMGYNKLIISLIKYIPQVLWNYKRKSTMGWNIWCSLLDMMGGVLSLIQTLLDVINPDYQSQINVIKFLLGLLTIVYDSILIFQHYILYPQIRQHKLVDIQEEEQFTEDTVQLE